jgi:hypothetical protein
VGRVVEHNKLEGVRIMKLKEIAFANTAGILGAVYFVGCYVVAWFVPDLYKSIAESWAHMVNLAGIWKSGPDNFGIGIISFTGVSWLTGYLFAWLYNRFNK